MSTKDSEALEQQRQRRNRINRMKTGIIVTITVWMLVSLLAIILLTVQVARLSSHVKRLEKAGQTTVSQNIPDSENVQAADTESSGQETQKSAYDKVVTGIDSGDNMAKEGMHIKYILLLTVDRMKIRTRFSTYWINTE